MDYLEVEEKIKATYRQVTAQYRRDDEIEVTTPNHRRVAQLLAMTCRSYPRPIRVLDVGCGTGRYFHCLENVKTLVGIDISEEMLREARRPVRGQKVTARRIELLRGNAYLAEFAKGSFDLVYSFGMFGHGCPVTTHICNRFYEWLAPGGKLLFNTVDFAGLPLGYRARKRVRSLVYPALAKPLQELLDAREQRSPFFGMTRRELLRIMSDSYFDHYEVNSHACDSPLWTGRHLECRAFKAERNRG